MSIADTAAAGSVDRGERVLDNPVWHALAGPHARFREASADGLAVRYPLEVSVFGAVDRIDAESWDAQARLVGAGGFAVLFRNAVSKPPAGWLELQRLPGVQLLAGELPPARELPIVRLGPDDVPEMIALVALTEPGPFALRTHELGRYVGVRREGRLVAMAGERFHPPGFTEISAVCTHPDVRREGLGSALTLMQAERIRARGEEAFLHAVATNTDAIRLYQKLGFRLRRGVVVVVAQLVGDTGSA